jgi:hypothetical protein
VRASVGSQRSSIACMREAVVQNASRKAALLDIGARPCGHARAVTGEPVERRVCFVDSPHRRRVRWVGCRHVGREPSDRRVLAEVEELHASSLAYGTASPSSAPSSTYVRAATPGSRATRGGEARSGPTGEPSAAGGAGFSRDGTTKAGPSSLRKPALIRSNSGGRDRRRSGDLPLFRRTLCQLSYSTVQPTPKGGCSGPDGTRTRDLRLDRPA